MPHLAPSANYAAADDLCVVACYFNPLGYTSKRAAARLFETQLRQSGVPLFLVECATGDAGFDLPTADLRVRCRDLLWQKERLLNLAIAAAPKVYRKLAWIDADVIFESTRWAVEASALLEQTAVVQLFNRAYRLPRHAMVRGPNTKGQSGFAAAVAAEPARLSSSRFEDHGHTGYAWAARREWLEAHPLFDACIVGGADHAMAHAFAANLESPCLDRILGVGTRLRAHFDAWAKPVGQGGARPGFVRGALVHLWHGDLPNRRYLERYAMLGALDFDPVEDVELDPNGCWAFRSHRPALHQEVRRYFAARQEDTSAAPKEDAPAARKEVPSAPAEGRSALRNGQSAAADALLDGGVRDLAVLTAYYNPCRYRSRRANHDRFRRALELQGVPVFTVECAFGGEPFELPAGEGVLQVRGGDVLWQKERLLNLALEQLPAGFTKVAWLDGDVLFERQDWARETSRLLDTEVLVQPFSEAVRLQRGADRDDGTGERWEGFAAVHLKDRSRRPSNFSAHGHTGFAWAARREALTHGLYDVCLSGSGDHLMAHAAGGDFGCACVRAIFGANTTFEDHYRVWASSFHAQAAGRIGALPGRLLHLWHGDFALRGYPDRNRELAALEFDPGNDLKLGEAGTWTWASDRPALHRWARRQFEARAEDG